MHGVNRSGGTVESAGANLGEARRAVLQSEDIRGIGVGWQIMRVAGLRHLLVCERVHFDDVDPWKDQLRDVRTLHKGVVRCAPMAPRLESYHRHSLPHAPSVPPPKLYPPSQPRKSPPGQTQTAPRR